MSETTDISVVIPAYQAARFIAGTLASIAAQSCLPFEVVVVDDGSSDATAKVVEEFARTHRHLDTRVLREAHRGPGGTRNLGVRAARGNWIAFLDADDHWHPEKLARMIAAIRANPEGNFFCHNEIVCALDGVESISDYGALYRPGISLPEQLYAINLFSTSAVVCRREQILKWGGFDESLSSAQDYELWLRMSPDMRPVFVREVLGTYILRSGNISTSRYWRRLMNILRIKIAHRTKVGWKKCVGSAAYAILAHVMGPIKKNIKDVIRSMVRIG